MHRSPGVPIGLALLVALVGGAAAAQPVQAGVAGGVVSPVEVSGPPRDAPRAVESGMEMFLDDRIRTGEAARMQLLLLDETVFTVGPNSDFVIDRYVYDPDQGIGEVTGTMATGFLRYVSGEIGAGAPENVEIRTPAATMGIRGTALMIAEVPGEAETFFCGVLGPGRDNSALARPGGCLLRNEQGETSVTRAGYGAYARRGEAPGPAQRIPPELFEELHALLRPVDVELARSERGAAVSRAARGDPEAQSGEAVAAQRRLAAEQFALLDEDYTRLTESSAIEEIQQPPEVTPEISVTLPFFAQLTWENDLLDLDLHATGPDPGGSGGRYHVFFAAPTGPAGADGRAVAVLGEAQSSLELSEVLSFSALPEGGPTRISVFNFSDQDIGSTSLAGEAGAMVSLLRNGLIERGPGGTTVITGDLIDAISPPEGGVGNTFVAYEIGPEGGVARTGAMTDSPNSILVE